MLKNEAGIEMFNTSFGKYKSFILILAAVLGYCSSARANIWLGDESPTSPEIQFDIIDQGQDRIILKFNLDALKLTRIAWENGYEAEIPGEGHISLIGYPSLPAVSRLLAIPAQTNVKLHIEVVDSSVFDSLRILPALEQPLNDFNENSALDYNLDVYNKDEFFPAEIARLSDPAIMHGLRLINLTVNPLRYNPLDNRLVFYRKLIITLTFPPKETDNILANIPKQFSRSFAQIAGNLILNFPELDLESDSPYGSILIIAPDNPAVLNILQPLIEWKKRKGYSVTLATLTETGSTSSQILNYIQQVYDTSDPQLEYLILIGDCAGLIAVPASNAYGDHDYTRLDGDDIVADIAVGRYSCSNTTQLATEVAKIVNYESTPFMGQTAWYKKGAVAAPYSSSGISTIYTKQAVKYKALQNNYSFVDTLFWTSGGSMTSFTANNINQGVGFYNYRGYIGMSGWSNSNTNNLTNYHKLPFVVTITCITGDITSSASAISEEFFRVGTPNNPTGAIGAIGTATHGTHTRHNNCMDVGIFSSFFDYGVYGMGDALNMGKYYLFINYPYNPTSVQDFSNWNNLIGDPTCQFWSDIPAEMTADYDSVIPVGSTDYSMMIHDNSGTPLQGADVCLYNENIHLVETSDEGGYVQFNFPPVSIGSIKLTCTKHNYIPLLDEIIVTDSSVYVNYTGYNIDDDSIGVSTGNNNTEINPGETIELSLMLTNFGQSAASGLIDMTLNCQHEWVDIIIPSAPCQSINPGDTLESELVAFNVSEQAPHDFEIPLYVTVSSGQGTWEFPLPLTVQAPDLEIEAVEVDDPDGILDPGEQNGIIVSMVNNGGFDAVDIICNFTVDNEYIQVLTGSINLNNIAVGQSVWDTFHVEVSPYILPTSIVDFTIEWTGAASFADTGDFSINIGSETSSDPLGPDEYGYYALDNTDTLYLDCPQYEWIEIDPTVPGYQFSGTDLGLTDFGNQEDHSIALNLPFDFIYYGLEYSDAAICSNGWLAFGAEMAYFTYFRNWMIPSTIGPYSMIAPFWDDLYLNASPPKKVYGYYDEDDHRFIIEWNVINIAPGNFPEQFQLILYDPEYYPTESGDGLILFQYQQVFNVFSTGSDNHFATIGIEDHRGQVGLQYSYWNQYPETAAPLTSGRAILFTTDEPVRIETMIIDDLTIQVDNNNIALIWTPKPGASQYHIYRSDTPYSSISGQIPVALVTGTEYSDPEALLNGPYFYRVTWE